MTIKVSISWAVWSGKSSIIEEIVQRLWRKTADVWQIFRARAIAKWMTINDYDKFVEQNPQEDVAMDNDFKRLIENSKDNIIVSRRLWFHFIPDMLTIRLDVSDEEWAQRVMNDNRWQEEHKYHTLQDAIVANKERTQRLKERIIKAYNTDFTDQTKYKKIIKTNWKTVAEVADEVIEAANDYYKV